ncbi:MAG: hypothetical protein ACLR06_17305 [Christensenellaceae bacterium]
MECFRQRRAEPAEKHWFSEYTVTDNADGSQTVEEKTTAQWS